MRRRKQKKTLKCDCESRCVKEGAQLVLRIKEIRESRGMTQKQLAEKIYVARATVTSWEQGARTPHMDMLPRIAEALDCSVSDLIPKKYRKKK